MKKRIGLSIAIVGASIGAILLPSCSIYDLFNNQEPAISYNSDNIGQVSDTSVNYKVLTENQYGGGYDALPGTGNINVLVIPVNFTDYAFTAKRLSDLSAVFNGTADATNYWQSVQSFYKTSSFGKVTIAATVADPYDVGVSSGSFMPAATKYSGNEPSTALLGKAVAAYKAAGHATTSFDSDGNGYIDAVYLVYAAPDYDTAAALIPSVDLNSDYWAYVSWDTAAGKNVSSPNGCAYLWASYDFMYEETKLGVDAHTFIHETGHLFGLDDYYNYDNGETTENASYMPLGGLDMMDFNILDHNCWSKWAIGWTTPYVISGSTSFTLKESEASGEFAIIPVSGSSFNGTPFDEFLMIELYSPDGLNEHDSYNHYGGYPCGFTVPGIKITHIDARLNHIVYSSSNKSFVYGGYLGKPTAATIEASSSSSFYLIAASNTPSYSIDPDYRLAHLLESDGENTFKTAYQNKQVTSYATNSTLFTASVGHNSFSTGKFSDFFANGTKSEFNGGDVFPYSITVNSISGSAGSYQATISVQTVS